MDYQLNNENLGKIINSECVPQDDSLCFDIEENEVTIWKPYIDDEDGEKSGNTVFVSNKNLKIGILANYTPPCIMFNENDTSFSEVYDTSPKHVIGFINDIWPKIMIYMEEMESYWNRAPTKLTYEDFKSQFGKNNVPRDLKMLFGFENEYGSESFSTCFYLRAMDKEDLKLYCPKQVFLDSFIEFATANGSGSTYAYWLVEKDLEKCPIIVFGDEGGIFAVANNTQELIHILTLDVEISVGLDGVSFYIEEDIGDDEDEDEYNVPSQYKGEFAAWALTNFGLKALEKSEEAEAIVENAQAKYQEKLNSFVESFDSQS